MTNSTLPPPNSISVGLVFRNEASQIPRLIANIAMAMPYEMMIEILGYDNNSSDLSADVFTREVSKQKCSYKLHQASENNMGAARAKILELASHEIVYFIDADIALEKAGLMSLISTMQEQFSQKDICAWSGPLLITGKNDFQGYLQALQTTWWGSFGSAQMQANFTKQFIAHAPTAHLLIRKSAYLEVGSFDLRLDRSGEDLEIHWRLRRAGYRISWDSSSAVRHDVAADWLQWGRKCFKYGFAQTQIAKIHPTFWFGKRCLPIWVGIFAFSLAVFKFQLLVALVALYGLAMTWVALGLDFRRKLPVAMLIIWTHLNYFFGEVWGIFRRLANPEISTTRK